MVISRASATTPVSFSGQIVSFPHDSTYSEGIIVGTANVPVKHGTAINEFGTSGPIANPQQYVAK